MQSNPNLDQFSDLYDTVAKASYQAFQQGKSYFSLAHKTVNNRLTNFFVPKDEKKTTPLSPEILLQIQQMMADIIEIDWQDAQKGIYPHSLLFDSPWLDFFRYYPFVWFDMPSIWQRLQKKQYQKFASEIDLEGYPSYYLQNFHNQTDGYLSEQSANLYDLQVELLFNGSADAMRRRILAPLKAALAKFQDIPAQQIRVLDLACGTGRTLKQIRATLPKASLFGLDLSPTYLRKANQLLSENPGELPQLLQGKAEELPYLDNHFHGLSCVFTFHELPPDIRQQVIEEALRVVQPGGVFVICDSIQALDFPELQPMLENFPAIFHEPYYRHYITDDLTERLTKAGFVDIVTTNHLFSKYWIAYK